MKKIFILAARNIFRNTRRTIITSIAIIFGIIIMINSLSYIQGLYDGMVDTVINKGTGHIQLHRAGYMQAIEDQTLSSGLVLSEDEINQLVQDEKIKDKIETVAHRMIFSGIANNGDDTTHIFGLGIIPDVERNLLKNFTILEGNYLTSNEENGVIISERLKRVLNIKLGDQISIATQTLGNHLQTEVFKVVGVFDPGTNFNFRGSSDVYMNLKTAQSLLDGDNYVTEVVLKLTDKDEVALVMNHLENEIKHKMINIEVHDWKYIGKRLLEIANYIKIGMRVWTTILFIAIMLGILNTFLMAVYERTHEIGILKAIGLKKERILSIFFMEAFLLAFMASLIGLFISLITVNILSVIGLPPMLDFLPKGEMVHPTINWVDTIISILIAIVVSSLAGLFPAWKAAKMNPMDALRHE